MARYLPEVPPSPFKGPLLRVDDGESERPPAATCKPESRRNLKPTKPAIEISDADRKRRILITDIFFECTMAFKKWREKGESLRV